MPADIRQPMLFLTMFPALKKLPLIAPGITGCAIFVAAKLRPATLARVQPPLEATAIFCRPLAQVNYF